MREILFRGKTPDGQWICGTGWTEFLNMFPERTGKVWLWSDHQWKEIIPETIGQYTGLKDKNGKMVFEGDIIECEMIFESGSRPHAGEVIFHNRFGSFATKNLGGITLLHNHLLNTFEIIGNIHDNPGFFE